MRWHPACLGCLVPEQDCSCWMKIVAVALKGALSASCAVASLQQQLWVVLGSVESLV